MLELAKYDPGRRNKRSLGYCIEQRLNESGNVHGINASCSTDLCPLNRKRWKTRFESCCPILICLLFGVLWVASLQESWFLSYR